jgi:ubiquinone/menaquinone biosynthesis C-methylase UbiE
MGSIDYHLKELEIGLNASDDRRILPELFDADKVILDLGCGIGQTFIALKCSDRICIGIDVDEQAIAYGMKNRAGKIHFLLSDAKRIPIASNSVNFVFSRVCLPYTDIPNVIKEIRRVLKQNGRVWMTLHGRDVPCGCFSRAIWSQLSIRKSILALYVLGNGYLLKYFGIVVPFVDGRYESWQDPRAMEKLLFRNGFEVSQSHLGKHIVIEGYVR